MICVKDSTFVIGMNWEWIEGSDTIKNVTYNTRRNICKTIPSLLVTYDTIKNDGVGSLFGNISYGDSRGVALQQRKLRQIESVRKNNDTHNLKLMRVVESMNDDGKSLFDRNIDDSILKASNLEVHFSKQKVNWVDMVNTKRQIAKDYENE